MTLYVVSEEKKHGLQRTLLTCLNGLLRVIWLSEHEQT